MRSIYCVGAVRAIAERKCIDDIRSVHASSAGCISAALLASLIRNPSRADVRTTTATFLRELGGRRFIDQRRPAGVVDVDHLVDVIDRVIKVSPVRLRERSLQFEVAVTNAATAQASYIELAAEPTAERVREALRATMAIPILYRRPAFIGGVRYLDGGIADPLPLFRAMQSGSRAVIAISSVPTGLLAEEVRGREKYVVRFAPGIAPSVRHLMLTRNPLADAAEAMLANERCGEIDIVRITPSNADLLGSRLELDEQKLSASEEMGYADATAALTMHGW